MISLDSENCLCFEDSIDLLNDALVHIESQINYTKTSLSDLWSKKQNLDRDTSLTLEAVIALGTEEDQAAGIVEDPALAKSIGYLRTRLRDLIKLSHRASFLLGSNYFK